MTSSSNRRETAMFKGHGHSATHKNQCKTCTPDAFPRGCFYPITLPVWFSAHWQNTSSAQAVSRGGLPAASTKEGLHEDQQNGGVVKSACWACSEVAHPCDGLPERLLQAAPNMEAPGLVWNPLSNLLASPMLFLGWTFREGQAQPGSGDSRRSARTFHSCIWFFIPQVKRPSCGH